MTKRLRTGLLLLLIIVIAATILAYIASGPSAVINNLAIVGLAVAIIVLWRRRLRN